MLTADQINEVLRYDAETGLFWWRKRISIRCSTTRPAGTANSRGAISIGIRGASYPAAALAWMLTRGMWARRVGHINGDLTDNRPGNLKESRQRSKVRGADHAVKNDLSAEQVRAILSYNPETGEIRRRSTGAVAGSPNHGYLRIKIGLRNYAAHRLAWLLHYGEWPVGGLDHADGIRRNNRIANLRAASVTQNNANARTYSNNKLGLKGVSWLPSAGKYRAQIKKNGLVIFLGSFDDAASAHQAYISAAREAHGEFARAA